MRVTSDVGPWSIVPEWVLDAQVSDRAVRLYALLGRYADRNGESFPSRQTLAKRLGCSESSAIRASRELEVIGALKITSRADSTNLYHLIYVSPVTGGGVTTDTRGGSTGDTQNESHYERETSLAAAPRKRNETWDALTALFGEATTRTSQTLRGKICRSLDQAGATPDEILARAKRWRHVFPNAQLTEAALDKHWPLLEPPKPRPVRARAPEPPAPSPEERATIAAAAREDMRQRRRAR